MSTDEARVYADTQTWEACAAQLRTFGERLSEWLDEVFPRIVTMLAPIGGALHSQYTDLGTPYGDTREGLMRWLREAGEANRLRSEAEAIEQRWRDQADLREWGRRMRARRDG